ncbi:MAG: branched-chain amino acid ABC transporter permease [Actinomycetota bacterium]|nr:branched-chain amino acid ABC transporter permease [Actinomycetota bacterium]
MPKARRIVVVFGLAGIGALLGGGRAHGATTTTTTPAAPAASIGGTLTVDSHAVPGVRITVSQGSTEVGRAVSDPHGAWRIGVPGPGTYKLALDVSTLPSGVRAERPALPAYRVFGSFAQSAGFTLTSGQTKTSGGQSRLDRLLNLFVSGIRFGLIVGLCAVGLSVIYGTTGLVNFAHGELVTFGALIAWLMNTMSSGPKLSLVLAAIIGMIATGVLGAVLELGLWRPLVRRRSGASGRMLVSIGLALVLRYIYQVIFKGAPRSFREYAAPSPVKFGPLQSPVRDYVIMGICLVVLLVVGAMLRRTRLGTAIRAVSDERDLSSASGINVAGVTLVVWIGGAMLAGLGGVMLGVGSQGVQWNMGFTLLLTMFAAIVLGGLGNPYGAMAGGLVVGVASQVGTYWLPSDLQFAIALVILILVLLVRPQGLLGVRERIG